jgi:hypothetical protein
MRWAKPMPRCAATESTRIHLPPAISIARGLTHFSSHSDSLGVEPRARPILTSAWVTDNDRLSDTSAMMVPREVV